MSIVTNLELIRRVPLFEVLTPAQAELVAAAVAKKRYKRGESVVEEGKTTNALHHSCRAARVLSWDRPQGRRSHSGNTLRAGDYLGEMSLIDGEAHSATVTTEVQTDVLVLGREDFLRCVGENAVQWPCP
jgi:CRP/FNR family cyclic AMP-dependent transcriptional regulator